MRYKSVIAEVLGETEEEPLFLLENIREDFIKGMIFDLLFERQKRVFQIGNWGMGTSEKRKHYTKVYELYLGNQGFW